MDIRSIIAPTVTDRRSLEEFIESLSDLAPDIERDIAQLKNNAGAVSYTHLDVYKRQFSYSARPRIMAPPLARRGLVGGSRFSIGPDALGVSPCWGSGVQAPGAWGRVYASRAGSACLGAMTRACLLDPGAGGSE